MINKFAYSLFFLSFFGSSVAQSPAIGGYNVYYGTLHNHSAASGATGTPGYAYNYAKNTDGSVASVLLNFQIAIKYIHISCLLIELNNCSSEYFRKRHDQLFIFPFPFYVLRLP